MSEKAKLGRIGVSLKRTLTFLFLLCAVSLVAFYVHIFFLPRSPFLPRSESYAPFERHYHLSTRFPFVTSYFLMLPKDYDPAKWRYPVVMFLHGVSRHMAGGKHLKIPERRNRYPVIVYIPIAPPLHYWAGPGPSPMPEALPGAMETLESIKSDYSVDENRIYITGYSMGGVGTYAALSRYHGIFAAAAPLAAAWDPAQADRIEHIPIWVFQGAHDHSARLNRLMVKEMKKEGIRVRLTDYPNKGHNIWDDVYRDEKLWDWLLSQQNAAVMSASESG